MRLGTVAVLLFAVLGFGCSHVSITRVSAEHPYESGLRFYRPWPYLLVRADRNDAAQAEIVYLPDLSEEYVIEPKVRLGSVDVKVTLTDGWQLASLGASADPQVAETIEAISSLLGAASSAAIAPREPAAAFPLPPGLYRLRYDGGHVTGAERVSLAEP
ncbi:MAG: hypothetical protein IT386_17260 [Deltaproteobacteria bacterium]|nr:hypothetical protein [Deltaproteobacteria bacterium]